jgi:hypothetical protein
VTKPVGKLSAGVWDNGAGMRMLRTFWDAAVQTDPGLKPSTRSTCPCAVRVISQFCGKREDGECPRAVNRSIDIRMKFESFTDYWIHFSWDGSVPLICSSSRTQQVAGSAQRGPTTPLIIGGKHAFCSSRTCVVYARHRAKSPLTP